MDSPIHPEEAPPESPIHPSPYPPEEAEPPDPGLGRSADGKSRRLRNHYGCTLGPKQVPAGVRQELNACKISRKQGEYQKWPAKRRGKADELMLQTEMRVPTVEARIVCPLSRF